MEKYSILKNGINNLVAANAELYIEDCKEIFAEFDRKTKTSQPLYRFFLPRLICAVAELEAEIMQDNIFITFGFEPQMMVNYLRKEMCRKYHFAKDVYEGSNEAA